MRKRFAFIIIALLISLFIYLFYRTENTVSNAIFIFIFSKETYLQLKQWINQQLILPQPFIYSLPEGLWVFSATLASKDFFISLKSLKINLYLFPLLFAFALEVLQLFGITNGTFDLLDLFVSILFWLIGILIMRSPSSTKNSLYPVNANSWLCLSTYLVVLLAHVST